MKLKGRTKKRLVLQGLQKAFFEIVTTWCYIEVERNVTTIYKGVYQPLYKPQLQNFRFHLIASGGNFHSHKLELEVWESLKGTGHMQESRNNAWCICQWTRVQDFEVVKEKHIEALCRFICQGNSPNTPWNCCSHKHLFNWIAMDYLPKFIVFIAWYCHLRYYYWWKRSYVLFFSLSSLLIFNIDHSLCIHNVFL